MSGLSFIFDTLRFYACEEPVAFPVMSIAKSEASHERDNPLGYGNHSAAGHDA
jgi:hypothetical protein